MFNLHFRQFKFIYLFSGFSFPNLGGGGGGGGDGCSLKHKKGNAI